MVLPRLFDNDHSCRIYSMRRASARRRRLSDPWCIQYESIASTRDTIELLYTSIRLTERTFLKRFQRFSEHRLKPTFHTFTCTGTPMHTPFVHVCLYACTIRYLCTRTICVPSASSSISYILPTYLSIYSSICLATLFISSYNPWINKDEMKTLKNNT